jgi:hypothetical protein
MKLPIYYISSCPAKPSGRSPSNRQGHIFFGRESLYQCLLALASNSKILRSAQVRKGAGTTTSPLHRILLGFHPWSLVISIVPVDVPVLTRYRVRTRRSVLWCRHCPHKSSLWRRRWPLQVDRLALVVLQIRVVVAHVGLLERRFDGDHPPS